MKQAKSKKTKMLIGSKRNSSSPPVPETNDDEEGLNLAEVNAALHQLELCSGQQTRTRKAYLDGARCILEDRVQVLAQIEASIQKSIADKMNYQKMELEWCKRIVAGDAKQVEAAEALNQNIMNICRMVKRYKETGSVYKCHGREAFLDEDCKELLKIECTKRSMEGLGFTRLFIEIMNDFSEIH